MRSIRPQPTCFTPNDSMESTETAYLRQAFDALPGFTPNDSMESTETMRARRGGALTSLFHPQRLDGEY